MHKKVNITGVEGSDHRPKSVGAANLANFRKLAGKKVAISVSTNTDLHRLGLSEPHINDISIEIARYVISNGATALYGGDLRQGGFTYYFGELSKQYKIENDRTHRFINYFPFPLSKSITRDVEIEFKAKQVKPKVVPLPKILKDIDTERPYYPKENVEDRYIYSECFRDMRLQMSKDCSARIVIGGKLCDYLGFLPGILEETWLTMSEGKPVYLIGGFGGAAAKIISLLKGEDVLEFTNEFQYSDEFSNAFKDYVSERYPWMDYGVLKKKMRAFTIQKLSDMNKLTIEENEVLFTSKNIHEILYLVIKGLKAL